jgi:hypothetical protein
LRAVFSMLFSAKKHYFFLNIIASALKSCIHF